MSSASSLAFSNSLLIVKLNLSAGISVFHFIGFGEFEFVLNLDMLELIGLAIMFDVCLPPERGDKEGFDRVSVSRVVVDPLTGELGLT